MGPLKEAEQEYNEALNMASTGGGQSPLRYSPAGNAQNSGRYTRENGHPDLLAAALRGILTIRRGWRIADPRRWSTRCSDWDDTHTMRQPVRRARRCYDEEALALVRREGRQATGDNIDR